MHALNFMELVYPYNSLEPRLMLLCLFHYRTAFVGSAQR